MDDKKFNKLIRRLVTQPNNSLYHFGVLGMKWGHRRGSTSSDRASKNAAHTDSETVRNIRKKKMKDMTDDELKIVATRMTLVQKYKKSHAFVSDKKVSRMSNDDLEKAAARSDLMKEDREVGVRKEKSIRKMTDAEVKRTMERHLLEKPYRDLKNKDEQMAIDKARAYVAFYNTISGR